MFWFNALWKRCAINIYICSREESEQNKDDEWLSHAKRNRKVWSFWEIGWFAFGRSSFAFESHILTRAHCCIHCLGQPELKVEQMSRKWIFFIGGRHWRTCAWLCRNTQFSFQIIFCSYFNFSLVVLLIKHTAVTLKCEFASNEEKKNENKKRTFNGIVPSECVSLSLSIYSIRSSDRWCNKTLCVRLCVSMRCAYGNFTQMKKFRLHNFIEVRLRQRLRRFLVWIWPYIVRIGERVAHGVTLNRSPKCCKVHIEHLVCIFSAFFGLVFFSEGVSHCVYRLQQ